MMKLFATLTYNNPDNSILDYMIGIRTSYDKSLSNQFCGGGSVIVCSNMMFVGDIYTSRKHTTHMVNDLDAKVESLLSEVNTQFTQLESQIEVLKDNKLNSTIASHIFGELTYDKRIIGSTTANRAWEIWNGAGDYEGSGVYDERNAWRLYNCITEVTRRCSPISAFQVHKDGFGLRVFGIVFEYFTLIDIYFVAESGNPGDTEIFSGDNIAHGMGGEVPRLGDVGDISPGNLTEGEKTRGEVVWGGSVPRGIGANDANAGFSNGLGKRLL